MNAKDELTSLPIPELLAKREASPGGLSQADATATGQRWTDSGKSTWAQGHRCLEGQADDQAKVKRNAETRITPAARELVPGDVIRVRLGRPFSRVEAEGVAGRTRRLG